MNQAAFFVFKALKSEVFVFQTKDNGIHRQKILLIFPEIMRVQALHKICAELSTGFVLVVSVPRGDQWKINISFGQLSVLPRLLDAFG